MLLIKEYPACDQCAYVYCTGDYSALQLSDNCDGLIASIDSFTESICIDGYTAMETPGKIPASMSRCSFCNYDDTITKTCRTSKMHNFGLNESKFREFEGALYKAGKHDSAIREHYAHSYREITNARQLCQSLRAGEYTFPGSYQLAFYANDSGLLCFDCVYSEFYQCVYSLRKDINDGWKIAGVCNVDDMDGEHHCDHCNKVLKEYSD